ncbi:MAG: hypothetical protein U5K76_00185 [Woeseiaceae bacterium]|nr:hypothetical protein [Woeseiaceae bacterium]
MAEKPDKTSVFMPLAIALALFLLAAGGVAWLQQSASAGADPGRATLAALSQSVALHASRVRAGDRAALDALAGDLERLAARASRRCASPAIAIGGTNCCRAASRSSTGARTSPR